jgi:hypothetical protein
MDNKPVLVEIAIFIVSGILFIALLFKLNSYVKAEKRFEALMMSDCVQSGATKDECEKMVLDRVWRY